MAVDIIGWRESQARWEVMNAEPKTMNALRAGLST
jgi:hypothetical protein